MAGRGWAWTAYDWDESRLFNYVGDAQNTYPIWNATPLVALDVYEHAYFIDFQTDRALLHRRVLRQPRLGRRQRLGQPVPDSGLSLSRPRATRAARCGAWSASTVLELGAELPDGAELLGDHVVVVNRPRG